VGEGSERGEDEGGEFHRGSKPGAA
jgi:hypothetical protein